jgi:hypothetical protein
MKILSVVVMASAGLVLSGCARSAGGGSGTAARNSVPSTPKGPVATSPAAHGVIGAGTELVIRTTEAISSTRDEAGKTYSAEVANDIVDQGSNMLVPKGSRAQLTLLATGDNTEASDRQLAVLSITVNGKTYQVTAAPQGSGTAAGSASSGNSTGSADRAAFLGEVLGETRAAAGVERSDQPKARGKEVNIPANTVIRFRLENSILLKGYTP